jgi:CheY-like chemotaxis protein
MPIMDGLETAAYLRKTDKETPIIAQTVYGKAEFREKGEKAGITEFIIKPIIPNNFLATLAVYLDEH